METTEKTIGKDVSICDMLSAICNRVANVASEKAKVATNTVNKEMRIASLSQERKKLIYALGEKVYARIQNETDDPYARRIEAIDFELEQLKR